MQTELTHDGVCVCSFLYPFTREEEAENVCKTSSFTTHRKCITYCNRVPLHDLQINILINVNVKFMKLMLVLHLMCAGA